jgi:hypothetical protein
MCMDCIKEVQDLVAFEKNCTTKHIFKSCMIMWLSTIESPI